MRNKTKEKARSGISRLIAAGIKVVGGYVFNNIVLPKLREKYLKR
jgi:hypothetical protein